MELLALLIIGAVFALSNNTDTETVEPIKIDNVYQESKQVVTLDSYPVVSINADDWLNKYADKLWDDAGQRKMQKDWGGRFVKLTGKIHKIHYNYVDGCYLTIAQQRHNGMTDGWCKFYCTIYDKAEIEKIMNMKSGDTVTLIGYSKWNVGPELLNCTVR